MQVLAESKLAASQRSALLQAWQSPLPGAWQSMQAPAAGCAEDATHLQDVEDSDKQTDHWGQGDDQQSLAQWQSPDLGLTSEGGMKDPGSLTEQQRNQLVEACLARNAQVLASLA